MKKVLLIVLVSLSLALPFSVDAADLKLTYKEKTNVSYLKSKNDMPLILPSYDNSGKLDGNLVLNIREEYSDDDIFLEKYSLDNKLLYKISAKEFYSNFTVNTEYIDSDNQYGYKVKGKSDILISVINANTGEEVFKKQYGGSGKEIVNGMFSFKSYDNNGVHDGYIASLQSTSTNLGINPGFIMLKYDLKGDLIWQKSINDYSDNYGGMFQIGDGKIDAMFVWSCYGQAKVGQVELGKTSTTQELWGKKSNLECFGLTVQMNFSYNKAGNIDGIILAGFTTNESGESIGTLYKYDLDGNEVFKYTYDKPSKYTGVISSQNIEGTYDGYLVAGVSDEGTFLLKYDYSGKIVWKDIYSSNESIQFKIHQSYDTAQRFNGYLLYSYSYDSIALRKSDNDFESLPTFRKLGVKKVDLENNDKVVLAKYTFETFDVKKETTDEGDITISNDKAYPGDVVKISVTPKDGYVLKKIVVTDESGKEIEVSDDGTFIMPEGKVKVSAIYNKIVNPDTTSACYVVLGIILVISVGTLIVTKGRKQEF